MSREEQLRKAQLLCPDVEWKNRTKKSDLVALPEEKGDVEQEE